MLYTIKLDYENTRTMYKTNEYEVMYAHTYKMEVHIFADFEE